MANWYATRSQVKRALNIYGSDSDSHVDRVVEAASRDIDNMVRRGHKTGRAAFLASTETRLYRWPRREPNLGSVLWVDGDLISVTTLKSEAQNSSPTTLTDYFLEPNNFGPPYTRIEIDLSSTDAFAAGDTPQRSISVEGEWGYTNDTVGAGAIDNSGSLGSSDTTVVVSDASVADVGDTLLIESERVFVSDRAFAALGSILINGALTADKAETTVTVDGSHGIVAGETVQVDSERMFVSSVATNDLTVIRAYDGTTLASHGDNTAVHIYRTLTIERGVNGSTAASHSDSTSISKYVVPKDVVALCVAEAIAMYEQDQAGWGRVVGQGEGAREANQKGLTDLRSRVLENYGRRRARVAAV